MRPFNEPRRTRRVVVETSVFLRPLRGGLGDLLPWGRRVPATTRDVSAAGMSLRVQNALPIGTRLLLWIKVQDGDCSKTLRLRTEVTRTQLRRDEWHDVGVKILDTAGRDAATWTRMVIEELRDTLN
jgi:hypothetical protein